jgi:hypothetical protein
LTPIRVLSVAATLAALTAAIAIADPAAAKPVQRDDVRDARYCEIFTLELVPTPLATVYNSLGLNSCPQSWWDALDPAALAAEHGVAAVVLNGPRHFIMDRVSVTNPGALRSFAGKRLRQVAQIELGAIGGIRPPPYTEIKIDRKTKFTWDAGRRVFELMAPDGRVYVMQAYAQIVDQSLSYGKLRNLGARLAVPAGWRFRTRRPPHDLVLRAKGKATIVQDELQNTYQREPRQYAPGGRTGR